jgi:hypothetical protein
MSRNQIVQYVARYARYDKDAPTKAKYYCNFPTPHSTRIFFSDDTRDLAEQIAKYCKAPGTRKVSDKAVEMLK